MHAVLHCCTTHAREKVVKPRGARRDYFFGFSLQSELGAVLTGLGIMIVFRILRVPLLDGLPSG
jgi:hypothetical protein